jgi:hypothetical protein
MVDVPTEKEELEALYAGGGLSRAELAYLTGERSGALERNLTREFISQTSALRKGDFREVEMRGFVISAPSHFESVFLAARPALERQLGRTSLAMVSPSPTEGRFAIPAVVPKEVATAKELRHARFARVHATVLNLENFGGEPARFLMAHELHLMGMEDYFSIAPPTITGKDVMQLLQERLNLDFPEVRLGLLAHMFSAPPYIGRAGGTGLSLLACEDRSRCLSKRALTDVLEDLRHALPPYLTGRRYSTHLDYLGIRPLPMRFPVGRLSWRFNQTEGSVAEFLVDRTPGEETSELSISTRAVLELRDFERDLKEMLRRPSDRQVVLSVCDLPILLSRDDLNRDERALELHQVSEDIAHCVVHSAMVHPNTVLEPQDRSRLVERILREIRRDWPDLERCMKHQVVFDLSAQGGLIEHATRAAGAVCRAQGEPPEEAALKVQDMFVLLFTRFYDVLEPSIRQYNAVLEKLDRQRRKRWESDVLDVLESAFLELEATFPDGWPYPELERLVLPRVDLGRRRLRERFEQLREAGEVVEVSPGIFKTIGGAELFL